MAAKPSPDDFRWEFRPPGTDYVMYDDDFTLDETEAIEEKTGVPWLLLNPANNLKVARAMLFMACIRAGIPDDEIPGRVSTLKDLKGVLTLVDGRKRNLKAIPTGGEAVPPTSASS